MNSRNKDLWEESIRHGLGKKKDRHIYYLFGWQLWFGEGWWRLFYSVNWGNFKNIRLIEGKNNLEKAKKLAYEYIIRQKQKEIVDIHKDIMRIITEG